MLCFIYYYTKNAIIEKLKKHLYIVSLEFKLKNILNNKLILYFYNISQYLIIYKNIMLSFLL